jgi:hypothetical protein
MENRIVNKFIIALLVIMSIGILGTSCTGLSPVPVQTKEPSVSSLNSNVNEAQFVLNPSTSVYVNPKSQFANPDTSVTLNIEVSPQNHGISSGELVLSFNAGLAEISEVSPGSLFGINALVGKKEIDTQKGTLTYSLARIGPTTTNQNKGVFAVLRLKVKPEASSQIIMKIIRIGLADENFNDINGLTSNGGTITISTTKAYPSTNPVYPPMTDSSFNPTPLLRPVEAERA